jgi:peptide/nickel transport system permease protein
MGRLTALFGSLRRTGPVRIGLIAVAAVAVIAAVRPELLTSEGPHQIDINAILKGPSWAHWLGTDEEGTDVLSRVIYGTRLDLLVAVGSTALAVAIGVPAGLMAGYSGKALDRGLQSVAVSTLAFPLVLFAVLIVASFGASLVTLVCILGFLFVPQLFLVTRAQTKAIREREFITAAVVTGQRTARVLSRHVLPNVIGPVLVLVPQLMATAILAEAGLSYLGLGLQPPSITWGTILLASKDYYRQQPAYAAAAGLVVTLSAALLMLAGDVTAESLDPRRRRAGARRRRPEAVPAEPGGAEPGAAEPGAAEPGAVAPAGAPVVAVRQVLPNPARTLEGGLGGATEESHGVSVPSGPGQGEAPVVVVSELTVLYASRGKGATGSSVKAVDHVSFSMQPGECLGLVGESGSGKSSIARALVRVVRADGSFLFQGADFFALRGEALRATRRNVQLIFQNPRGSIDPRQTARQVVREPIEAHGLLPRDKIEARVDELMHQVGFDSALSDRRPHQLSGGQCQRLAIARSLGLRAELLICDEPTSALDVSVQAQIINLLKDLQEAERTSYLFISHDLAVVRQLAHSVAVLYKGQIVERAPAAELFSAPAHPYTIELLSSVLEMPTGQGVPANQRARQRARLPVSSATGTDGCSFADRCPHADERCERETPVPETSESGHLVQCHHWRAIAEAATYVKA